ncbi:MAG: hypothetical protein ABFC57_06285 [Veillonellales bacterium]
MSTKDKAVQKTEDQPVVKVESKVAPVTQSYVSAILEATKQKFLAVNAGMDLDFVNMGESLKLNKKGIFVLRSDETQTFGDTLDVVIAKGEIRYMLWGAEKTPEAGTLLVSEKTPEAGQEMLEKLFIEFPEYEERYNVADIKINYAACVVPINTITPDETPEVYILFFPQTGSYSFGHYAMGVFKGDKSKGIPKNTGVNAVITRVGNKEDQGKDNKSYLAYTFESIGMFNPEDFGIKQ